VHKRLRDLFDTAIGEAGCGARLRDRLRAGWRKMEDERIATDEEIDVHRAVYADAYEQSWRGLRSPVGQPTLAERIAPCPAGPAHRAAAAELRGILASRLSGDAPVVDTIATALVDYLRVEQAVLASVSELQDAINALLERPRPTRPLTVRDFHVVFVMHPPPISAFPYVFDVLESELGIRVECTANTIEVSDRRAG
jgi:hypothetical protein